MLPLLPEAWVPPALAPPLIALSGACVAALALAAMGARRFAGAGAAAALVATLFLVFGVRMVTPRMLPERLPWLALAASVTGLAGDLLGARGAGVAVAGALTGLGGAWFILGAPRALPDLDRVLAEALPVLVAFGIPLWRLLQRRVGPGGPAEAAVAAALLAVALHLAGSAAAFVGLALVVAAAALGLVPAAFLRQAGLGLAGGLGIAAGLAGVVAASGLAQRAPAIFAAAAAPLAALLLGPAIAGRVGGGWTAPLATAVAGLPAVAAAWAIARFS